MKAPKRAEFKQVAIDAALAVSEGVGGLVVILTFGYIFHIITQ